MFDQDIIAAPGLSIRPATGGDLGRIDELRRLAIDRLLLPGLTPGQRATVLACTPLDPDLVHDGTYYLAELDGRLAACGGWSRRAVLIRTSGGAAAAGSAAPTLLPEKPGRTGEAAAIRAMYVHPACARLGLASLVLAVSETAARLAGFRRARLIATAPGRRLYGRRGWTDCARLTIGEDPAGAVEVTLMEKAL